MVVKTKRRDRDVVVYIAARHYAMPKGDYVVRAPPWRVTTLAKESIDILEPSIAFDIQSPLCSHSCATQSILCSVIQMPLESCRPHRFLLQKVSNQYLGGFAILSAG